jgi:hypothetical protein
LPWFFCTYLVVCMHVCVHACMHVYTLTCIHCTYIGSQ